MKTYGDEDFIFLIREKEEEENRTEELVHENHIHDGYIIIDEERLLFNERSVLEERVSMMFPDSFELMSEDLARIKYPAQNRPEIIYTNPATTINVSFSHKADKLENHETEAVKNIIQTTVMKLHSASKVIDSKVMSVSGINIAYFDFVSAALDTDIYNLMFFFSYYGTLVIGSFNCLQQDMYDWKDICIQMLNSIKFEK